MRYQDKHDLVREVEFFSQFKSSCSKPEVMYGLPREVHFCSRCVISNQRPSSAVEYEHTAKVRKETIGFDQEGICSACRVAEAKRVEVNWCDRESQLHELCNRFRKNGAGYDCLIPGSGGKDSFYAAHMLKYKYGTRPLTVTWAPRLYTPWGYEN